MPRHRLLPDAELRRLLGIPADRDALARRFTLTPSDQDLVLTRRGAANRLGFAVQLALLRHSGRALAQIEEPLDALVAWLATQIHVPAHLFTAYARRPQTMTDHARQLAAMLGLRPSTRSDFAASESGYSLEGLDVIQDWGWWGGQPAWVKPFPLT